ncbi:MAG: hypothetical protein ACT4OK_16900 [Gemmobacter sp.]
MTDDDTPLQPLFTDPEPGTGFTVAAAARRIAEPGEEEFPVATQLRGFVQRRLVHVRGVKGSGRTAHNLFAWTDLAAATVLRTLTHLGIADNKVLEAASTACYAYHAPDQTPVPGTGCPIRAALHGYTKGEWWTFRLDVNVGQDGKRTITARVFNADDDLYLFPMPPAGSVPMVTVILPIPRFADRILQGLTVG